MPATITHAYFAKDLYQLLDKKTKKFLEKEKKSLMMFSQNTDSLMFYNILSLKKGNKIRKLQKTVHTTNTDLLFENIIYRIKEKNYQTDAKTMAFLYGMICHYSLDHNAHPFIFYKTGLFIKKEKETHKYNGLHHNMETYIDHEILKKNHLETINFKDLCFDFSKFSKELNDTISYSFEKTFQIKNMDKIYYKSLKQMEQFLRLFRLDQHGYKRKVYQLLDQLKPKNTFPIEALSYHIDQKDKRDYLNTKHKKWNYPIDPSITSTKSFDEIYQDSLKETKKIIENVNQYLYHKKPINIHQLFQNKSYTTGVDCKRQEKQKYFEF